MVKTLFQASTWNALALGNFDTVISVRELLRCADTHDLFAADRVSENR